MADLTSPESGSWNRTRPAAGVGCQVDYPVGSEFRNIGAKLPGGLPYQPWAAALVKERTEQLGKDDPVGFCKPGGAVRILTYPPYRKFLQLPDLFLILSERDVTYRQIFVDGRPLPHDPDPTFNGYSTGRWDGDVLVVQTNGLRDGHMARSEWKPDQRRRQDDRADFAASISGGSTSTSRSTIPRSIHGRGP
jgi:hypothetical protein